MGQREVGRDRERLGRERKTRERRERWINRVLHSVTKDNLPVTFSPDLRLSNHPPPGHVTSTRDTAVSTARLTIAENFEFQSEGTYICGGVLGVSAG